MAQKAFPLRNLLWLGLGAVAFACATAEGDEAATNAGANGGASSTDGDVNGGGASDSGAQDAEGDQAAPDAGPCTAELKINEVQTAGPNGDRDEFVELFNDGPCALPIDDYSLFYEPGEGAELLVWSAATGQTMQPGQFFVVGGAEFEGASDFPMSSAVALDALGGALGLKKGGAVLDSVGWGEAAGDFLEGSAAPAPPSGSSTGRFPDGTDTDDNEEDFKPLKPSPRKTNNAF